MASRYEIRVLEGSADDAVALRGSVVTRAQTEAEARIAAEVLADDHHYGVVIVDVAQGLYDWGEGWRREDGSRA